MDVTSFMKMDQRKEHGTQYKDPRTTQKALTNFIAGAVGRWNGSFVIYVVEDGVGW